MFYKQMLDKFTDSRFYVEGKLECIGRLMKENYPLKYEMGAKVIGFEYIDDYVLIHSFGEIGEVLSIRFPLNWFILELDEILEVLKEQHINEKDLIKAGIFLD